jgi:hypothetical protein
VTLTFQGDELKQLLKAHVQSTRPDLVANGKDQTLLLPDWLGTGYKRDIWLRNGISFTLHHYQFREDTAFLNRATQRNCFEFKFVMTGKAKVNQQIYSASQQVFLLNSAVPGGHMIELAEELAWAVDVHIDTALLMEIVLEHTPALPAEMYAMIMGKEDRPALAPLPITADMQTLLQQVWQCSYQGLTRLLYLEAKALELIALYIQSALENRQSALEHRYSSHLP